MPDGNIGVGGSNIGFMLSFIDNASQPLNQVTTAYERMVKAMDRAEKAAGNTTKFNQGMNRIAKGLQQVTKKGQEALGGIAAFASLSRGKLGQIKVNVVSKVPRLTPMAKGGVVTGPTPILAGEAGPEAIIPLGRGMSGMKEVPAAFKFISKAFKDFRRVKKEWMESFGENAKKIWQGVSRNSKPFFKGIRDILKGGAIMQAGKGLEDMANSMSQVASSAGDFAGTADTTQTFAENTREIAKSLGMSRKELKEFRKDWAGTLKVTDALIDSQTDMAANLMEQGFTLKDNVAMLSESLALIKEASGADLTDMFTTLNFQLKISQEGVVGIANTLLKTTQMMRRRGLQVDFKQLSDSVNESAQAMRSIILAFPEKDRTKMINSIAAINAGFQSAGMEADGLTQIMTQFIAGGIDEKVGMAAFGMSAKQMAKSLKEGDVEGVLRRMTLNMNQADPTNLNAALEAMSEIGGFDVQTLIEQAQNFDLVSQGAKSFHEEMSKAVVSNSQLGEQVKSQRTMYEGFKNSLNGILLTIPGFQTMQSVMEDINFIQIFGFIEVLKGVGGLLAPLGKLINLQKIWTGVQAALNAVMAMNPIVLVVLGIAALTAAIVILWKKSETFRNIVIGLWEVMKGFALMVWDKLLPVFQFIGKNILWLMGPIGWMIKAFQWLKGILAETPAGEGFFGWIKTGIDSIMKGLGWLWDKLKGIWDMFFKGKSKGAVVQAQTTGAVAETMTPIQAKKEERHVKPASKKDKVEVDQSEVIDVLEKILSAILNMDRGGRRGTTMMQPTAVVSPSSLAVNGEM